MQALEVGWEYGDPGSPAHGLEVKGKGSELAHLLGPHTYFSLTAGEGPERGPLGGPVEGSTAQISQGKF